MEKSKPKLQQIPLDLLFRSPYQPRQHFDQEKLQELAESIKSTGLLQPIVVRPHAQNKYEIVAGERRWRAAQLAGLAEINCLVHQYTDEQVLQAAIVENISRTDLNPIEEAQAYQRLITEFHYLHEEVAALVGKSRVAITNSLRLLKLEMRIQQMLITGLLSEGHGKILAGLPSHIQFKLAEYCIQKGWSVRKTEIEAKKLQHTAIANTNLYQDTNTKQLETALSEHLGNKVQIEYEDRGGGYVRIRFNNIDELEGHFDRFGFKCEE